MRARDAVEGAVKSMNSTGSHTTNTRISAPLFSLSSFSVAEAPRKQALQVGENVTRTRMEDAELLNASFSDEMLLELRRSNAGCPCGTELPP